MSALDERIKEINADDSLSESEKNDECRKAATNAILCGGNGPKTPTRQYIGEPAKRVSKDPWAGGFKSDALGVAPEQIPEATAALRAGGCMANFDQETGALICHSQGDYDRAARATGMKSGKDGFHVPGQEDGTQVLTGRERERAKAQWREDVMRAAREG